MRIILKILAAPIAWYCRLHSLRARDISYGESQNAVVDIFAPRKIKEKQPVIIFWHGGSWKAGDKKNYCLVADYLRSLGAVVVVVGYPLYPDQKFPGFISDALDVIDWTAKNIEQYGGDNSRIFLSGHSAGAHTALIATLVTKSKSVKGCFTLAAPADVSRRIYGEIFGQAFEKDRQKPAAYMSKAQKDLKFLIIHGTRDKIVPFKDARILAEELESAGLQAKLLKLHLGHFRIILTIARPFGSFYRTGRSIRKFIS